MNIDWTVKFTDLVMICAVFVGPIFAVRITEFLRKAQESQARRVHIFRTLMATRAATLAQAHIEALNLVEIEFQSSRGKDRKVVDSWRIYIAHLNNDSQYPQESWEPRRAELLSDLLYEMSSAIGYAFNKSDVKKAGYYPRGYGDAELDNYETRKLWLQVLKNERAIRMNTTLLPLPGEDNSRNFLEMQNLWKQFISGETQIPVAVCPQQFSAVKEKQ